MRLSRGIASVDDPAWKRDTARPFTRGHKPAHSRSARVVMLVSVEMRPPKVGERGWWAVPGATPEAVLRDVISEIEDTGPGWIADESQAGRPDTVTVHVDWTREEVP